jgi:hypothetical protein
MTRWILGTVLGLVAVVWAVAPTSAQEITLGGELRPRYEVRDLVGTDAIRSEFTSMRTRASIAVAVDPGVGVFVQLQDVRVFGEEGSTLGDYSADGLDLHQGWMELGSAAEEGLSIRVGRQAAAYGGERLLGAVDWAQQGRSFDGVRVRYRPSATAVVDGLAFRLRDSQTAPGAPPDESLYGVYSTLEASGVLDLFALVDTHKEMVLDGTRYTLGARWVSSRGRFNWRVEGAYQGGGADGALGTRDFAAFMVGGRVATVVREGLTATLWYDYLSGDNDTGDSTVRAFDTLFATNHKFYGYMDFFTDIPGATNQRGLQDVALKGSYSLGEGRTLRADIHSFRVAAADGLPSGHIGDELDMTYNWTYAPGVTLTGGLSYFVAGSDMPPVTAPGNNEVFGYVMADVRF